MSELQPIDDSKNPDRFSGEVWRFFVALVNIDGWLGHKSNSDAPHPTSILEFPYVTSFQYHGSSKVTEVGNRDQISDFSPRPV